MDNKIWVMSGQRTLMTVLPTLFYSDQTNRQICHINKEFLSVAQLIYGLAY